MQWRMNLAKRDHDVFDSDFVLIDCAAHGNIGASKTIRRALS
jgi:hypothetical protein